jgi:hypothetical protein
VDGEREGCREEEERERGVRGERYDGERNYKGEGDFFFGKECVSIQHKEEMREIERVIKMKE